VEVFINGTPQHTIGGSEEFLHLHTMSCEEEPWSCIPTIHCSCKLIIYRFLSLWDVVKNKAFKCKCVVKNFASIFCQLKENKKHIDLKSSYVEEIIDIKSSFNVETFLNS